MAFDIEGIRAHLSEGTAMVWALGCEPPIELAGYLTYCALMPDAVAVGLRTLIAAVESRSRMLVLSGQSKWKASQRAPVVVVWISAAVAHDHFEEVGRVARTGQVAGVVVVSGEVLTLPLRSCVVVW